MTSLPEGGDAVLDFFPVIDSYDVYTVEVVDLISDPAVAHI